MRCGSITRVPAAPALLAAVCASLWGLAAATGLSTTLANGQSLSVIETSTPDRIGFSFERRYPDGARDRQFGPGGRIFFEMGIGGGLPLAVHSDASGHILVAGSAALADGSRGAVVMRFLSTGQIDTNWGDRGQAWLAEGRRASVATDVLPVADGSVLVVGAVEDNGSQRASIWRIAVSGHADPLFGRQGVMLRGPLPTSQGLSIQQGTDGALQLAIQTFDGGKAWIEMHRWATGDAVPRRVARQELPQQWVGPASLVLQRGHWFWIDPSRPEDPVAVMPLKGPDSPWSQIDPPPVATAQAPPVPDRAARSPFAGTTVAEQSDPTDRASMTIWLGMAAAGLLVAGAVIWRSHQR